MKLIHYSECIIEELICPIKRIHDILIPDNIIDPKNFWIRAKPHGLWVSVEGKQDWKWWCEAEEFRLEHLNFQYEVILKEDANILYLKSVKDLDDFTNEYGFADDSPFQSVYLINWNTVREKYSGIIIAPYQWDRRLDGNSSWYYGWDCASGCIWDKEAIKEFNLVNYLISQS